MLDTQVFAPTGEAASPERSLSPEVAAFLPASRDYADDDNVKKMVQDEIVPLISQVISNRRLLEEEWHAIQRMWMMKHDSGQRYFGRSNSYLPSYAQARTTLITNLARGLFPSDDYIDVLDRARANQEAANNVKTYLQYQFDQCARIKVFIKPFIGQLVDFGNAVLKFWYETELKPMGKFRKAMMVDGTMGTEVYMGVSGNTGLRVSARSMFNTYVYPETAESERDFLLLFEALEVPFTYAMMMKRLGRWKNIDEGIAAASNADTEYNRLQTARDQESIVPSQQMVNKENKLFGLLPMKEAYCCLPLPRDAYAQGEVPGTPLPVRIMLMGSIPVSVRRNQDFHQMPPYLFARQNVEPGAFYGSWVGRKVRPIQYLVNDTANQANDCGNLVLNPITIVNTANVSGLTPLRPGALWKVRDIAGVKFDRPPIELIPSGQQMLSQYQGMLADMAGAPPVLQGTSAGRGARTATSTNILQNNAMGPLQDVVNDIEETINIPLMSRTWTLCQQYDNEGRKMQVLGEEVQMLPRDIDIDAEFSWGASSQAVNRQQRAAQAMQLLGVINPQILQLLQAQGKTINPETLIDKIYHDGFGFRSPEKFVVPLPPPPAGMPGMPQGGPGMAEGQPGQAGAPGGVPDVRSPLDNTGGQPVEQSPGSTDGFMDARSQGDEFSRELGAQSAAVNDNPGLYGA